MEIEAIEFLKKNGLVPEQMQGRGRRFFDDPKKATWSLTVREEFIKAYCLAVPNEEALKQICKYSPLLELGAGSGYWAYELRKRGADIIATEPEPETKNQYVPHWKQFIPLETLTAKRAVKKYPERNLLIIWPPYGEDWPTKAILKSRCRYVIYIGEWGGCTADESFHDTLMEQFKQVAHIWIPQFYGLHDYLSVWKRR